MNVGSYLEALEYCYESDPQQGILAVQDLKTCLEGLSNHQTGMKMSISFAVSSSLALT